jgi:hypothetical protein
LRSAPVRAALIAETTNFSRDANKELTRAADPLLKQMIVAMLGSAGIATERSLQTIIQGDSTNV